jgi:hypothetical protein
LESVFVLTAQAVLIKFWQLTAFLAEGLLM